VFMTALYVFHERRADEVGALHFTKDDPPAVALVAAAANLRSRCYGIPTQSQFAAAGMAGNIIHAIATTNAVVAGLITTEALKLLAGCRDACRNTWLTGVRPAACMLACCSRHNPRHSARPTGTPLQACTARAPRSPHCPTCMQALPNQYGKLSTVTVLPRPNSACMVCGHALMCVTAPLVEFTLARLVDVVLKRDMAFAAPTIELPVRGGGRPGGGGGGRECPHACTAARGTARWRRTQLAPGSLRALPEPQGHASAGGCGARCAACMCTWATRPPLQRIAPLPAAFCAPQPCVAPLQPLHPVGCGAASR
jgi:hypothetical protein